SNSSDEGINTSISTTTKAESGSSENSYDDTYNDKENELFFFDYKKIKIDITTSIGVKIKNCNLVLDYFGNLNLLGEIENISTSGKTNIVLTFDFYDKNNQIIFSDAQPLTVNYLRVSTKIPFSYTVKDSSKFIDIAKIKTGVNYKDYYKLFSGNVIARQEQFYYKNNILHIEGRLINIGESKVDNLILLASFYNKLDGVVFIKQGYLPKNNLLPQEQENFSIEVLLGKYTPDFTHYDFEVFFEDSIKMP
ncbi:MAG: hypothetical protein M1479_06815, partial [Actinobacteria bacterium]|nr:hypothetical protein [Actinomycetota bacterium]